MEVWHRNIRMMHHIGEFLDLDAAKFTHVAEFIALIQALREGLLNIDEEFAVPDAQLNLLFLSKLRSRAEWNEWAMEMMRDKRVNASNPADRMAFQELAHLAIEHEKAMAMQQRKKQTPGHRSVGFDLGTKIVTPTAETPATEKPTALSQDEINEFVIHQMNREGIYNSKQGFRRGHGKKPSQEEINDFVVQQMRKENGRKSRNRSRSQPELRGQVHQSASAADRCAFCSDSNHLSRHCWRRWRVAAEAPQANYTPKRVEFRTEIPGQPPMYRTGFTLV